MSNKKEVKNKPEIKVISADDMPQEIKDIVKEKFGIDVDKAKKPTHEELLKMDVDSEKEKTYTQAELDTAIENALNEQADEFLACVEDEKQEENCICEHQQFIARVFDKDDNFMTTLHSDSSERFHKFFQNNYKEEKMGRMMVYKADSLVVRPFKKKKTPKKVRIYDATTNVNFG